MITFLFAPRHLPRCRFGDSQNRLCVSLCAFFTPKQVECFMGRLRCWQSGGKRAVLFGLQCCLSGFTAYIWKYSCTVTQVVVVHTVHLVKLFTIAELVWLFFPSCHTLEE